MSTKFLSLALPANDGAAFYCAFDLQARHHTYHKTLDGLEHELHAIDARGHDAYFCTALLSRQERNGLNAVSKQAFMLDIDYKDIDDPDPARYAQRKLALLRRTYSLPVPTMVVESGGGVHIYWSLTAPLAPAVWKQYGTALKAACAAVDFKVDPTVPADVVRLLRCPGTKNYKYAPPRAVTWVETGVQYAVEAFASLAPTSAPVVPAVPGNALALLDISLKPTHKTYWIESIVASGECVLFANALRPENQQPDQMSEGLWVDLLATCSKAEDGRQYAHAVSMHDTARYGEGAAVEAKLSAWAGQQHPRTCAVMAAHGKCGGCKHQTGAGSPIRFGYMPPENASAASAPDPGDVIYSLLREFHPTEDEAHLRLYQPPTKWPDTFGFDPVQFRTLVRKQVDSPEGEKEYVVIPVWDGVFWPQFKFRNAQGILCYEFVFWAKKTERPVRHIIPDDTFGNTAKVVSMLVKFGFPRAAVNPKMATNFFNLSLDLINRLVDDSPLLEALGWSSNFSRFNLGFQHITTVNGAPSTVPAMMPERLARYNLDLTGHGSLQKWQDAVATFCGPERAHHQFAITAGFASVLMPLTPHRRSHLLHLYSQASGSGKTSVQATIWSIWANPLQIKTANSTYKALVDRFSAYGNLPGIVDEITLYGADNYRALAFDLASGEPRQRLSQSGELLPSGAPWCLLGVSSANVDIEYEIKRNGNAEGELARMTSVLIPPGRLAAANRSRFEQIFDNYGLAGREFVGAVLRRGVTATRHAISDKVEQLAAKFCRNEAHRSMMRFKLDAFAAILVANEITTASGLTFFAASALEQTIAELAIAVENEAVSATNNTVQDIRAFITASGGAITRMVRTPQGGLELARKIDGFLLGNMNAVGNTNFNASTDCFIVANDWATPGLATIGPGVPALYISQSKVMAMGTKIFPSIRTDPMKTLGLALEGTGYRVSRVEEFLLGFKSSYLRIEMPRDTMQSVQRKETVNALAA